jgi:alpha-1,2-mannosyltransferase
MSSLVAFGAPAWGQFFADATFARSALENNLVGDEKMQSVFAAVRLLNGSLALAWGAQIATAICVVAALWQLRRRVFRTAAEAPAVVCAGLLASPFLLDYDLAVMAIPLVWLLGQGVRSGFLPFEKAVMAFAFLLPLISRVIAGSIGLPLAPLTIAAVFALTMRRASRLAANGEQRVARGMRVKFPLSPVPEQW